ncbi:TPA: hypothetical protein PXQ22_004418 [Yersinia enterocolitica]|nr:hypothetical protein [Yersinia enterocolitica]
MLITLELTLLQEPKHTLFTMAGMGVPHESELIEAINGYLLQNALTPPGIWTREYKGLQYITQSAQAKPFFMFLKNYELVPDVGRFIKNHFDIITPSKDAHPDARFNIWVSTRTELEPVAIAMQLTA